MKAFRVGIDSYSLKSLGLSPFEVLDWAIMNEADGVQFSEVNLPPHQSLDKAFLGELRSYAAENGLYLEWGGAEHVPVDPATGRPKDISSVNRKAAEEARLLGVPTVRSCSGGLWRWKPGFLPTSELLELTARSLSAQKPLLEDLGVCLAIETHFEFTTFELLRLFESCRAAPGGYLGVCLDTMNLLTMLEDPLSAVERILPWVVTTHIKDGAILLAEDGLTTFTAEAGTGIVDLEAVLERLSALDRPVNISLEDHGGEFDLPVFDPRFLAEFPDLRVPELIKLLKLALQSRELLDEGRIAILERSRWPEVCEKRLRRGLRRVKGIIRERSG